MTNFTTLIRHSRSGSDSTFPKTDGRNVCTFPSVIRRLLCAPYLQSTLHTCMLCCMRVMCTVLYTNYNALKYRTEHDCVMLVIYMHTHTYTCIHMHTHAYTCVHSHIECGRITRAHINSLTARTISVTGKLRMQL